MSDRANDYIRRSGMTIKTLKDKVEKQEATLNRYNDAFLGILKITNQQEVIDIICKTLKP